ncbi:MAG: hypothetical protein AB7I79_16710 [Rhizobiaceae bacterium]
MDFARASEWLLRSAATLVAALLLLVVYVSAPRATEVHRPANDGRVIDYSPGWSVARLVDPD